MVSDLLQYDFYWFILQSERKKKKNLIPKRRIRNMHQEEHHRDVPLFCVIYVISFHEVIERL